ncbi:uncharacterized protein LOC124435927 [Xenia sp. Carnegie-2017]|uniref:uncharacterized protein LOC124435927 n=1 Tax=Xenia sp. Carnegie-2017 TaxID=2897299 RepID=UPI001F050354|nr:uncharacterized protein LOC124435927 [Xenia sp. Carnegie-2017]
MSNESLYRKMAPHSSQSKSNEDYEVECNVEMHDDHPLLEECVESNITLEQPLHLISQNIDETITVDVDKSQPDEKNIAAVLHYTGLLLQFSAVTNLGEHQSFAILDYNVEKRKIMHTSYVFVHRYPHYHVNGFVWLFGCSCDRLRLEFVQALSSNTNLSTDKVVSYPKCLHILAMERFLETYDENLGITSQESSFFKIVEKSGTSDPIDHSYCGMFPKEDLFKAVSGGPNWIAVKPVNREWGVCTFTYSKVALPQAELRCSNCSSYLCIHVTTLGKALEIVQDDDDSQLAYFKLAFETSPEMRNYYELATRSEKSCDENDANHFAKLLAMNWSKIFVPSACGTCSCGAAWDKRDVSDDWLDVEGCHVAYLYDFHCVNVYYRPCSTCTNKKRYDGIENNVLWFGSFSISHAVLKDYIRHFLVSRLLDIDFVDAFHCNICGKHPKKVVMDGTALGIQKTFLPRKVASPEGPTMDGR